MKKAILVFVVLASILFVVDCVFAESLDYNDLAGRKLAGTRIVSKPSRMFIKANLEIANVTNGEAEGSYRIEVNGELRVYNFKAAVEQSQNGLPTFKFKSSQSELVEFICEVQRDGRLVTMRTEGHRGDRMNSSHVLDPVK